MQVNSTRSSIQGNLSKPFSMKNTRTAPHLQLSVGLFTLLKKNQKIYPRESNNGFLTLETTSFLKTKWVLILSSLNKLEKISKYIVMLKIAASKAGNLLSLIQTGHPCCFTAI